MSNLSIGRRSPVAAALLLALVALCVTAVSAFASHQVAGAQYKGHIRNYYYNTPISFKVNKDGTKVRLLITDGAPVSNYPACMQPNYGHTTASAPISKKGKFKAVISYAAGTTTILGTATVTGKFRPNGRETGVVTGSFDNPDGSPNPDCNGVSDYSTHVVN